MENSSEATKKLQKLWDLYSSTYSDASEYTCVFLTMQLALQCKVYQARAVLEAACGSGLGTTCVLPLLRPGTVYCSSDFSEGMLGVFRKRSAEIDFARNPYNSVEFVEGGSKASAQIPAAKSPAGVSLKIYHADNEHLPFADSTFDAYIASSSLYIVDSAKDMISESYRVLRKGGMAGFSVFGKEGESPYVLVCLEAIRKFAAKFGVIPQKIRSPFYLGGDDLALEKMFLDAGYSKVKMWHDKSDYPMTGKEFADSKKIALESLLKAFPEEAQKGIMEEIEKTVRERFELGKEVLCIDTIIAICTK